jgi:hypothetical protein
MQEIIIEVTLRIASDTDFYFIKDGKLIRKYGMPFFVLNQKEQLELYKLTDGTNTKALVEKISEKKVFIIKEHSLNDGKTIAKNSGSLSH